ncbi:MAG TPA: choice-of-anchor Q domain-containing protein, partial [Acidimicrobiales bacterium]|nr:choice-of-anchor Q domain-containing protein [Acidimicrobiales bacterium]
MTTLGDPSGQNRAQRRAAARRPRATAIAGGASVLAAGLSVVGAGTAGAVPPSFVVTSLEDEGDGTLRDVIATAASEPGHDVITFDVTGTIVVEDQLEIIDTDDVTIQGPGVGVLTLDGEDSSRIFYLGGEGDITISGMTLHDGFSIGTYATGGAIQATEQGGAVTLANLAITSSLADGSGAGVMANGDITITGSVFAGNESPNGTGAHVLIAGGVGVIEDSTFEGSAGSSAIAAQSASSLALDGVSITDESVALEVTSYASLAVVDSTIEADRGLTVSYASAFVDGTTISGATNSAISASVAELRVVDSVIRDNEGDVGAGIRAFNSWLAVERSTLTANHTRDHYTQVPGGAISFENQNSTRELGVVDSTISGNTAAHGGGGIGIVVEPGGTADATILRSTVTDNDEGIRAESVTSGFTPCMPYPVLVCFPPPTITSGTTDLAITGSIVAGNTEDVVADDRIQGDATSNVDPVAVTATYSLIDVDPMLAPLTDNGAATETHHPIDGSPAIDAGDPAFDDAEEVDQRDEPRLVGGRIDIGSVEVQAADAEPAPEPTPEPEPGDGGGGGGGGNEDDEATAIPSGDGDRTGRFETDEGTVELTVLGAGGSEDVTIETGSSESLIDEDDDDGFDLLGTAFDIDVDTDEDTEVCLPYDD